MTIVLFVAGLVLLVVGAEVLIRGASRLAAAAGISPLIIGLTVVAFGTSSPELAVSVKSALADQAGIAVGNVIGSNIFNVLFILGAAALVAPLVVAQQLIRIDVPLMIAVSALTLIFAMDEEFTRIEGVVLFAGLLAYIAFLIRQSRRESKAVQAEYAREYGEPKEKARGGWLINVALVIGGLALLVLGSRWLVDSAVVIAQYFAVSDLVIGLTIVAAGTSLPELFTSVIAGIRGERDIAVGNIIGSNLFNIMGVLGVASIVAPSGIDVSPAAVSFDIPVMIAVAFVCLPIFFTGGVISRWEGALLLGYYLAYTAYLILDTTHHDTLPMFSMAMLYFVLPLTALTLSVVTFQAARKRP
ncbi:MAG: K+dependent Na+ exchanger related-protein [Gammaproteobacteria bacterium]|nr:MAG: K+dependent Na+ exchanger related-protein [Gammaproteobacteria bacterium]TND06460.1 MAG: K+dependent Na+ exchanger related-protein [Gammaproteobacteria bacterium]